MQVVLQLTASPLKGILMLRAMLLIYKRAKHNPSDFSCDKGIGLLIRVLLYFVALKVMFGLELGTYFLIVTFRSEVICWHMKLYFWGQTVGSKEMKGISAVTDPTPTQTGQIFFLAFLQAVGHRAASLLFSWEEYIF